jgi:hypothetical protein
VTTEALEILVGAPTIIDHPHRIQVFFGKTKKQHQNLPVPVIDNSLAKSVWHRFRGYKNSTGGPNS